MPNKYPFKQRILTKETIECIKQTIRDNENIDVKKLIAMLHVNPPYISKDKAMEIMEDMKRAGTINVDSKGEVSTCRC